MYYIYTIRDTVRVPPEKFGSNLDNSVLKVVREEYEGLVDEDVGVVIAAIEVENLGDGKVVPGDGAAYYEADIKFLVYKPEAQEVVEGFVSEVTEFGAFLRTGPVEGLIHVSQIMDDYINYDAKLPGFVGRESRKKLLLNDQVIARVATVSLKGTIAESKIGLTMRQEYLGKAEWGKMDEKMKSRKASAKKPAAGGRKERQGEGGRERQREDGRERK